MRPKASQSAKDFLIELPERDTSRMMKKPLPGEENRSSQEQMLFHHAPSP